MQHDRFMASYKTRSVASAVILDFLSCILTIILQSTIKHTSHSLTPNLPDHLISSPCQHPWIISATWVYPMNPLRKHYYIHQCTCDIVVLFLSKLQANPAWLLQHKVITVILKLNGHSLSMKLFIARTSWPIGVRSSGSRCRPMCLLSFGHG